MSDKSEKETQFLVQNCLLESQKLGSVSLLLEVMAEAQLLKKDLKLQMKSRLGKAENDFYKI